MSILSKHDFDPERPGNPGSENHPVACKPCNKFNPSRPVDSCKHGKDCEFCHCSHERPKHRGQRGRHALQRRQYLESRDEQPLEVRELVDNIYQVPHSALDEVKRRLTALPPRDREEKVMAVLDMIRDIGEIAQRTRPDSSRLKGARIVLAEGMSAISELDGRCKWLVGTLHLMVRKMLDAKEPIDKVETTVNEILDHCRRLPEALERPYRPDDLKQYVQSMDQHAWIADQAANSQLPTWLTEKVQQLARGAVQAGEGQDEVEKTLASVRGATGAHLTPDLEEFLRRSTCLKTLAASIMKISEKYKECLLEADSLDDCEVTISLSDIQAQDQAAPSSRTATAAAKERDPGSKRDGLAEELEVVLRKGLDPGCRFLEGTIRSLAAQDMASGAPRESIEANLDKVLAECSKLPKLMPTWENSIMSTEDVVQTVKAKLSSPDSLQLFLSMLTALTTPAPTR